MINEFNPTPLRNDGGIIPQFVFIVVNFNGNPIFIGSHSDKCRDYINDLIEHGHHDAKLYKIVSCRPIKTYPLVRDTT